ncbi:MAG TPA: hypothetical protein VF525_20505 [Pyrinomonadaceae bacterium]|jgi:hypothetical protein
MKRKVAYFAASLVLVVVAVLAQFSLGTNVSRAAQGSTTPECETCKNACQAELSQCLATNGSRGRGACVRAFEHCVIVGCRDACPPGHNNPHNPPAR